MASTLCWCTFLLVTACLGCLGSAEDVVTYTQTGVTVHWRSVEGEEPRAKRMVHPAGMRGFPHQEKMAIVKKHNSLRKAQYSSNMNYMSWNEDLARNAQKWSDFCYFTHSGPGRGGRGFAGIAIGELMFASTYVFDTDKMIQLWYDEYAHLKNHKPVCEQDGRLCGHWKQIVSAKTKSVGCGVTWCKKLYAVEHFDSGYFVVCHYGPAGHFYNTTTPYKLGRPCTRCEGDYRFCAEELCSWAPKIGGSGQMVVSHSLPVLTLAALLCPAILIPALLRQSLLR